MNRYTTIKPPTRIWIDSADLPNLEARGYTNAFPKSYDEKFGASDGESLGYIQELRYTDVVIALRDLYNALDSSVELTPAVMVQARKALGVYINEEAARGLTKVRA